MLQAISPPAVAPLSGAKLFAGDTPAATGAESCSGARVGRRNFAGDTPAATGAGISQATRLPLQETYSYFGQAAFSFAAIEAYSSGGSFLLGAVVPGGPSPK